MAESFKGKVEEAGRKVSEAATQVGHAVGEKVEQAADRVKETAHKVEHRVEEAAQKVEHKAKPLLQSSGPIGSVADIREHQEVYASCGTKVGKVDRVEGDSIKLTKDDSPDGRHHRIPLSWVAKVHDHIHLDRDHKAVQSEWQPV